VTRQQGRPHFKSLCKGKATLSAYANVNSKVHWFNAAVYFSVRNKSTGIIENYLQVTM